MRPRSRVRIWSCAIGILTVVGCQASDLFQRDGVEGGGLAQCPCGCGAFVVSCPRGVGSDTSSGCLSQQRGPFSSRSTTRSKGEKRREKKIILKCEPWRKTRDKKEKYKRCRDNHRTRKKNSRVCVVHELPARSVVVTVVLTFLTFPSKPGLLARPRVFRTP